MASGTYNEKKVHILTPLDTPETDVLPLTSACAFDSFTRRLQVVSRAGLNRDHGLYVGENVYARHLLGSANASDTIGYDLVQLLSTSATLS